MSHPTYETPVGTRVRLLDNEDMPFPIGSEHTIVEMPSNGATMKIDSDRVQYWRCNRFEIVEEPASMERTRAAFDALSTEERDQRLDLAEAAFAAHGGASWASTWQDRPGALLTKEQTISRAFVARAIDANDWLTTLHVIWTSAYDSSISFTDWVDWLRQVRHQNAAVAAVEAFFGPLPAATEEPQAPAEVWVSGETWVGRPRTDIIGQTVRLHNASGEGSLVTYTDEESRDELYEDHFLYGAHGLIARLRYAEIKVAEESTQQVDAPPAIDLHADALAIVAKHYEDLELTSDNLTRIGDSIRLFLDLISKIAQQHNFCGEYERLATNCGIANVQERRYRAFVLPASFETHLIPKVLVHGIASAAVEEYGTYYETITNNITGLDWPTMDEHDDDFELTYTVTITGTTGYSWDEFNANELADAIRNGDANVEWSEVDYEEEGGEGWTTDAQYDTSDAREFFRALDTLGVNY